MDETQAPDAGPIRRLPIPFRVALAVTATALTANLVCAVLISVDVGDPNALDLARQVLMWVLITPLAVALIALGALGHRVGRWHVAALFLCVLGDGLGAATGEPAVLLAFFLAGHVAYLVALWPTRQRSLGWGRPAFAYAAVGLGSASVIAVGAGPLAVPVVVYAIVLAAVAGIAAIDTPGFLGGLLFLASDLALGLSMFVIEVPDPVRSIAVLVTYAAAQTLLALSLVQRLDLTTIQLRPHRTPTGATTRPAISATYTSR